MGGHQPGEVFREIRPAAQSLAEIASNTHVVIVSILENNISALKLGAQMWPPRPTDHHHAMAYRRRLPLVLAANINDRPTDGGRGCRCLSGDRATSGTKAASAERGSCCGAGVRKGSPSYFEDAHRYQPWILNLVSDQEIAEFLPEQLQPVDGATGSQGAHLQAGAALTLAEPGDRAQQVIRWLC